MGRKYVLSGNDQSAAGTVFWVDPEEELVVVSMIQLMLSPWPLRSDLKIAIYQALEESYAD